MNKLLLTKQFLICWIWFLIWVQSAFVLDTCPPQLVPKTVDAAPTHRPAFFTPRYYRRQFSLTSMNKDRHVLVAAGRLPQILSSAGPDTPQRGGCPPISKKTEEEAPLLLIDCPDTLQPGTTHQMIKNRLFNHLITEHMFKKSQAHFFLFLQSWFYLCNFSHVTENRPSMNDH